MRLRTRDRHEAARIIAGLGGAVAIPLAARAQQAAMPVIGFLGSTSPGPYAALVDAVRQGLKETGYIEGQDAPSNSAGPTVSLTGCPRWRRHSAARLM